MAIGLRNTRVWLPVAIAFFMALFFIGAARADTVLTVTGPKGTVDMDEAAIAALPPHETRTDTPWTDGVPAWAGPLLRDVYAAAGITAADTVKVTALNDYAVTMPAEDGYTLDVILATSRDGAALSVRDKGPLFIIYPFAADDALRNEVTYSRSVWQVRRIELTH